MSNLFTDPDPPRDSTEATDGDISLDYSAYLATYIMGADAPLAARRITSGLTIPTHAEPWTQTAWDSIAHTISGVWQGAGIALTKAADASVQYSQTKDALISDWDQAKQVWQEFIKGRDLDEPRDGRRLTTVVTTVRDGWAALEKFRLGNLRETVTDQIARIEDSLELLKTQATTLAQGAAAYGGRPSGGGLATAGAALNELQQVGGWIREIAADALKVVKLFDLLGTIEDDLFDAHLSQANPVVIFKAREGESIRHRIGGVPP